MPPHSFVRNAVAMFAILLLLGAAVLYSARPMLASDHQDSPLTVSRPAADITDVFVFPSPENPGNVVLAMNVYPLIPTGMGTTKSFDPGVMYQFKMSHVDQGDEDMVLQFRVEGIGASQKITMYGPGRPNLIGTQATYIKPRGSMTYNQTASLPDGVRAFAGPREDPFYFDLTQFFKIIPDRDFHNQPNPPAASAQCSRKDAQDFLLGFNVLSIVVDLPRSLLADNQGHLGRINVWATTSLPQPDPQTAVGFPKNLLADVVKNMSTVLGGPSSDQHTYVQVERLGRPAVKEATESFMNHDATNRVTVTNDKILADSIHSFVKNTAGRSDQIADAAVKLLIPDAIEADLNADGPARYMAVETNGKSGFPIAVIRAVPPSGIYGIKKALGDPYRHFGGRDLKSPVIDISLGALFGSLIPKLGLAPDDGHETPCLTSDNTTPAGKHVTDTFPYVGTPQ